MLLLLTPLMLAGVGLGKGWAPLEFLERKN
jgi:hypothetical protein